MRQKFFIKPFGIDGDLATIPDDTQTDGSISYQEGWGIDYQRQKGTDPLYKPLDRTNHNGLFNDITTQLQQYQSFGTPEFITSTNNGGSAFSYDSGAKVRYSATGLPPFVTYISMVDSNTSIPGADTNWRVFGPSTFFTADPSLLSNNGYRLLPAYPGDPTPLIIQWLSVVPPIVAGDYIAFSWPIAFPNVFVSAAFSDDYTIATQGYYQSIIGNRSLTGARITCTSNSQVFGIVSVSSIIAIGY